MILKNEETPMWRRWQWLLLAGVLVGCTGEKKPEEPVEIVQESRTVDFMVSEGTWMSTDVAPDGSWVVFDLLGHVYRVDRQGGSAECLTVEADTAIHFQPRVSPDGEWIAFVSDRAGYANLWLMRADGSDARLLHPEPEVRVVEPAWLPDGSGLVAGRLANGNYDIWLGLWRYPIDGSAPEQLVEGTVSSPSLSAEGKKLYFQRRNSEDLKGIAVDDYSIQALELATGGVSEIVAEGALAPRIGPDGRYLAFARRSAGRPFEFKDHTYDARTSLWMKDLESGAETLLLDPIEPDIAETDGDLLQPSSVLPMFGWTQDSGAIVVAQRGGLRWLDVASGQASPIPFEARVARELAPMARSRLTLSNDELQSRFLRWASRSPDGRQLAVQAFGRIWIADLTQENLLPRRATSLEFEPLEFAPAWSPDGRWLVFATWNHDEQGGIWKVEANGASKPELLTRQPGMALNPDWSLDGRSVVFVHADSDIGGGRPPASQPSFDIVTVSASGGERQVLRTIERAPRSRSLPSPKHGPGGRIYFTADRIGRRDPATGIAAVSEIRSMSANGDDEQLHATFPYIDRADVSPDGRWLAVEKGGDVYLVAMQHEAPPEVNSLPVDDSSDGSIRRLGLRGGLFPSWHDATHLDFVSGDDFYSYDVATGSLIERPVHVTAEGPAQRPSGKLALVGARLLTLEGDGVIDNGDVIIEGQRITCVGRCDSRGVDRVLDLNGKVIMPGIVDTHGSVSSYLDLITPRHNPRLLSDFAYGVTTMYSPSGWAALEYPMAELLHSGEAIGPRLYSGADKLRWDPGPYFVRTPSFDAVEREVLKRKEWGVTAIKQYLRERDRASRRQVAEAARLHGVGATAHLVKGFHEYAVTMAIDGYTGTQHIPVQVPYYKDVVQFFGAAGFTFNPTIGVAGGITNEGFFLGSEDWSAEPRLRNFMPPANVAALEPREPQPKTRYALGLHAQGLHEIVQAGGFVSIGSHGQYPGLSPHWEIWLLGEAFPPLQALRSATMHGAQFLGLEDEIGSIAPGKLADLLILGADPLENLRNTMNIEYVIQSGVVYEAETLDQVWPESITFPGMPWSHDTAN